MKENYRHLTEAFKVIKYLQDNGINPLLYGSLGVSTYLGPFKEFGDVDLLVEPSWLGESWDHLMALLSAAGFNLTDLKEHEFQNQFGLQIAFAPIDVLTRDGIVVSLDEVITIKIDDMKIRTLTADTFKKAYIFSEKDGYRRDRRGKKDREIIELLNIYIQQSM